MPYPLTSEKDGIKMKPEIMKAETLYHCLFQNKVMLVYKDHNEILNCMKSKMRRSFPELGNQKMLRLKKF